MTGAWGVVSVVYLLLNSRAQKRALLPSMEAADPS